MSRGPGSLEWFLQTTVSIHVFFTKPRCYAISRVPSQAISFLKSFSVVVHSSMKKRLKNPPSTLLRHNVKLPPKKANGKKQQKKILRYSTGKLSGGDAVARLALSDSHGFAHNRTDACVGACLDRSMKISLQHFQPIPTSVVCRSAFIGWNEVSLRIFHFCSFSEFVSPGQESHVLMMPCEKCFRGG